MTLLGTDFFRICVVDKVEEDGDGEGVIGVEVE